MPRQLAFGNDDAAVHSARCIQLRKFGEPTPWLACRVDIMSQEQFRRFYDEVEATEFLPRSLQDSMPRFDDQIVAPSVVPEQYQADLLRRWEAWSRIWGTPPWKLNK